MANVHFLQCVWREIFQIGSVANGIADGEGSMLGGSLLDCVQLTHFVTCEEERNREAGGRSGFSLSVK